MIQQILTFLGKIDNLLWGPWTLIFIALVSLYPDIIYMSVNRTMIGRQKRTISAAKPNCNFKCLINTIAYATSGNMLKLEKCAVLLNIPIRVHFCSISPIIAVKLSKNAQY